MSTHKPSQRGHSRRFVVPTTTAFMSTLHRGQDSRPAATASGRSTLAPQWEQNFAPWKISPKQDGQATVASRAPQCSQRGESDEVGAPHIGQLSVSTAIGGYIFPRPNNSASQD